MTIAFEIKLKDLIASYLRLNSQLVPLQLQDINQEEKQQEPECLHNKGNVCTRAVDLFSP